MKTSGLVLAAAALLFAGRAMADTYYVATHYESDTDGQSALAMDADTLHDTDDGHKIVDIVSVNAGDLIASSFTTEIDCDAHAWRVRSESDIDIQQRIAPNTISPRELPPLSPVAGGTPSRAVMDFVCAWPGSKTGAVKVVANDPIALSKALAPTLKFDVKPIPGN